ncbi:trafficking protein particle complex subunit 4 isoform X1 [Ochotona princeps]|uniref:trafficking protein particle complex subunit 4 isoform X1 n=1 Tax=Ochotona princeps TaxID=9978 RepID=UPI002714C030|nr:trafficking protein particle complex subunit 4 isoform X1 [Ochotona princeps]
MAIFSVYVVNKAGGLIYQLDSYAPRAEAEKTFSYPLDLLLKLHDERVLVAFGQRDGIRVGHAVLAINGADVNGKYTADGKEVLEYLGNPANYPVSIRFGRPRLTSNEKLMLASMFHSLFAIGSQLSPEQGSSGIEMLETDTFKLHCFQTLTDHKLAPACVPSGAVSVEVVGDCKCMMELELASPSRVKDNSLHLTRLWSQPKIPSFALPALCTNKDSTEKGLGQHTSKSKILYRCKVM